jgi:hypothetical protein
MPSYDRALWALRTWLDSWPGIECIAVKAKQNGWAVAEDRWQRRISAGA